MSAPVYDVAVIGGGLHGLSAAMYLSRAGKRVIVLERHWPGRHASGASAAGVRSLNRDPGELDLSLEAMDIWHRMESLVGDDCGFRAHGQLCVGEDETSMATLEARVNALRAKGYTHVEMIDAAQLRQRVPALSRHCLGAAIAPADGAADPHRTLIAFRRSAQAAGATIREGCTVERIEAHNGAGGGWTIDAGEAGAVTVPFIVNAAGAWGSRIAAMVGDQIPLETKSSMMIASERLQPFLEPVVSSLGRPLSFKQAEQGGLIIGGGLQGVPDLDAETSSVRLGVLARGARAAAELFPAVRSVRIVRIWAGLEAKTADMLPVVGPAVNAPGVFHAFGYSGHGFELVPIVGAVMVDLIVHGSTRRAIGALQAMRLMH